jgi:sugar/nucleoside kinase (ribokinase family)
MPDVLGLGEIILETVLHVSYLPEPSEKVNSTYQTRFPSGVTANYVTSVSRLGTPTGFIGAVGDDPEGEYLIQSLKNENIDTKFTLGKKGKQTPINYVIVDEKGQKIIIQSPHLETTKLDMKDIGADYVSKSKLLYTTAIHPKLSARAVRIAKRNGVAVLFGLEPQVAARGWEALKELVKLTDVLLPQRKSALELTQASTIEDAADILLRKGPSLVVITLAEKGCLIATKKSMKVVPPFKVSIVDTTGAGDAFNGGFTIAHMKGLTPEGAGVFANAVAALKCMGRGSETGMPTLKQVKEFLETQSRNNGQLL